MPLGDAVQKQPTLDEQVASFKTFATTNGEVSNGEQTDEEAEAIAAGTTGEETPEAETGEEPAKEEAVKEEKSAAKKDETPKPKKTADERIGDITRQYRAEQRARAALEQRLAALERGDKTIPLTQRSAPATEGPPDPKDATKYQYGELDGKYIEDLTRFTAKQAFKAEQERVKSESAREAATAEQRQIATQAKTLVAKGSALHDDFEEVVMEGAKNGEWLLSDALGKLLLTSEHGAAIAYQLATHPDEAEDVFGKAPLEQAAWLGRQEAKHSSASPGATAPKPAVKVTRAPQPPAQQAKGAGGNGTAPEETADFTAFERKWRASVGF